jgi:TolB-like protein
MSGPNNILPEQVLEQVGRILASPGFVRSESLGRLLRFTVNEAVYGRGEQLKEYTVGVEGLGRPADFDGRIDPIVRVQARTLRSRVDFYYTTTGIDDEILISYHKGSYEPRISWNSTRSHFTVSLAILPFSNLASQSGINHVCHGLAEELIHSLSRVPRLRVIAYSSASALAGSHESVISIAKALNVGFVIDGSVRTDDKRLRVAVQLMDGKNGAYVWTEVYDSTTNDLLSIQEQIANDVTARIGIQFFEAAKPVVSSQQASDAYDLYLKGNEEWRKRRQDSLFNALNLFGDSIKKDPGSAHGHVGLAKIYCTLSLYSAVSPHIAMPKAKQSAWIALSIDPELGEAHMAIAAVKAVYERDCEGADQSFRKVLALIPGCATAHQWHAMFNLLPRKHIEECLTSLKTAFVLDPDSAIIATDVAAVYNVIERFDDARELCRFVLDRDPKAFRAYWLLGQADECQGNLEDAIDAFKQAIQYSGDGPFGRLIGGSLGHAYALAGRVAEANQQRELLRTAGKHISAFGIALIEVGLGRVDEAIESLEEAFRERCAPLVWLGIDPRFAGLRQNERFISLMRRLDLP